MDYKLTLNLPKTDFPMKADLPKKEPVIFEQWEKKNIYVSIQNKTQGLPKYILHDGPPYANGDIHIGHALNKTLKDIILKYKTMRAFNCAYVPGWDCHGLPIEHQLLKELKINKTQISQLDFRKKAHDYAMKYVGLQKEQFKRLGIFGDWDNPYLTLSRQYEEGIVDSFGKLAQKGYIYRGLKPVNWCYKCETALAEAEVEYEDHVSPSVYVKFKLTNPLDGQDAYLLIWTTTPWTLLANVAVAVHQKLEYVLVNTAKGILVIAESLLDTVIKNTGLGQCAVISRIKGEKLDGLVYEHPFLDRKGKVVLADYVSHEEGTGLVHTAPGHGNDDYFTGIKYKLDIIMPVDNRGNFDASTGEFKGMQVFSANDPIIQKLDSLGMLVYSMKYPHSYPHCWRCKSPVIFRATNQWFLKLEHNNLRQALLEVIQNKVKWIPSSGKERIGSMVGLRPDWCLSRQRYWGVPIPSLVCNNCKEEFLDNKVIEVFRQMVKENGTDVWFESGVQEFLYKDIQCPCCAGKIFSKGTDILDVWFDSGVSSQSVLKKRSELEFPASLYLEGSDQHRGWFQSSLIPAVCIDNQAPFKSVLTHGFVVDGQGRKMSKSQGNVVSPFDIIKDYGADILRLWVASSDYNEDIRISKEILQRLSEGYRKVRNTCRFILSNLYDFNPDKDRISYDDMGMLDKWILYKSCLALDKVITNGYEEFEFYKAYKGIYDFCNEDLSMYYLDMVKGRLYTYGADSLERRSAQTAIYDLLNAIVRVVAPILSFTAEEIWFYMPKTSKDKDAASVHLLEYPDTRLILSLLESGKVHGSLAYQDMEEVLKMVPDVAKALEEKRIAGIIGSSFDAKINILTKSPNQYTFLRSLSQQLCEAFKVSSVIVEESKDLISGGDWRNTVFPDVCLAASKADGVKCMRCWNYSHSVGEDDAHPSICKTCLKAIGGISA
ncbi:MAG: isoleucine--tRNA ligase [Candidatus Omnitrophica bacterium]|jgi:isoleucyl-tRNA synthetase|nr:isoleucine--tRNA ligase [Candidatus Omnitrophota bacterium]